MRDAFVELNVAAFELDTVLVNQNIIAGTGRVPD
jgi:hypothetical protein